MKKKSKKSDQDTLAEVTKEMAKPPVAMSARKQIQILQKTTQVREHNSQAT
jgi:hypothetical protein